MAQDRILGPIGTIKDIKPAAELGSKGLYPVAIIEHPWQGKTADAWILVPEGKSFEVGDRVRMFKKVEGNLTTHYFEKEAS